MISKRIKDSADICTITTWYAVGHKNVKVCKSKRPRVESETVTEEALQCAFFTGSTVLLHWNKQNDTIVYMPFNQLKLR